MRRLDVIRGWGRILQGYQPALSIEITKECPLSCPGCYAYQPAHIQGTPLVSLSDFKGQNLVDGVLALIDQNRPLIVFLVGGEPLVRFRELNSLLPQISQRGVHAEVVTSAVRPLPQAWAQIQNLALVVSIDGLQPEHDARRKPATYERILKHIGGHEVIVHCTVTSQMARRSGDLRKFVAFWSSLDEVKSIRVSLFTPQVGEDGPEILPAEMRRRVVAELEALLDEFPKLTGNHALFQTFLTPPESPEECLFAQITQCTTADLKTNIGPCQFGGTPNCAECGCIASMALHAVGNHRLPGGLKIASVYKASRAVGTAHRWLRERVPALS